MGISAMAAFTKELMLTKERDKNGVKGLRVWAEDADQVRQWDLWQRQMPNHVSLPGLDPPAQSNMDFCQ